MVNIITLNTWGACGPFEERWRFLLKELYKDSPDIVFLQEISNEKHLSDLQDKTSLPFSAMRREAGLAIATKFEIITHDVLIYDTRSPQEDYERAALIAEIKIGTHNILLANTHLAWRPDDELYRLGQVTELINFLKKKKMPAILAGDFNDVLQNTPLQTLVKEGYVDLFGALRPNDPSLTWDNLNPYMNYHSVKLPDRRIDFIFASKEFSASIPESKCRIILNQPNSNGIYASDHYGVFAQFAIH
ncbi:MAG: hypothetical protein A3G33_05415 [Omnitrophica bacterium RIFCSPLOWO2_12_FULL_44_17]|uniref:Endonuclease/exonuclease/phosphatase domain-containing protein n=1 Tax=Candidatus Danuiimicrobium aquiferis TaxID=1801832 RepID=A0A1G1L0M2_9BACT|nr:MAG: hypothetical protein A3B72_04685 [Omnitrophica bacterium RIFCSPHIGHO2_02_FULL_45_28]OGW89861.1 MAG: hypothetical protein A3E74_07305 [Omnitrophica bacterium RIFCSPHIGHO2_12_FULL_44_12]OGW98712.1 MAG: hypothetical protein A3G33_05415 [Omnitrophica bacterium RIFCSPLOWO2_12_FULL_44_17]OGX03103.1 MAG: hypothetical protein A3J12_05820 [Omnitrophica bacterium RIFCSPLOWO2_02_FULL_44_11]